MLHSVNFLHRDVKPENILAGLHDPESIYLIDLGLAVHYKDENTGEHIPNLNRGKFSGNFMFSSLHAVRGKTSSRRDDIEAAMYLLIFWLNQGALPWSNFATPLANLSESLYER